MPTLRQAVYGPPPLLLVLLEDLIEAATLAAQRDREKREPRRARPAALTLRPGADTPLWNELVRQISPHLRIRGNKAQLARMLGLPRQRLQDCLKARSALLDAERTLMLLGWLGFFQRGGRLAPTARLGRPKRKGKSSPKN